MFSKFFTYLKSSLDTHSQGASARKLTAFWMTIIITLLELCWLVYAIIHDNFSLLIEILIADISYGAALLGLTTWQSVKETNNKKEKQNENNESPVI